MDATKRYPRYEKTINFFQNNKITEKKFRICVAHPNIKLFITHGGALGLNEAVYEGVPLIGIPFYGDQKMNIKTIQAAGAGELLWYDDITTEHVLEKIKTVISNKKYEQLQYKSSHKQRYSSF